MSAEFGWPNAIAVVAVCAMVVGVVWAFMWMIVHSADSGCEDYEPEDDPPTGGSDE